MSRRVTAVGILMALLLATHATVATDPADEVPTDPSITVLIDSFCMRTYEHNGTVVHFWNAAGRTEGAVRYGAFTFVYQYANGSRTWHDWWLGLPGDPTMVFRDRWIHASGPRQDIGWDWSEWFLHFPQGLPSADVASVSLYVRAHGEDGSGLWNQATRIIYTEAGGFECFERKDGASLVLAVGLLVGGVSVSSMAVVWARRRKLRGKPAAPPPDT